LILVPTYARAVKWKGLAEPPTRETVAEEVDKFKKDKGMPKLLLAARYDGVDLPGDTCRLMVIDDLPMGVGPLERYLWEYLNLSTSLRTSIASRICQSFGRISRGMSDHGVIFLTGEKLIQWLLTPRNIATLPAFLQKQISLGLEISDNARSDDDLEDALNKCLSRADEWVSAYERFMNEAEPENFSEDAETLLKIAKSEADFGMLFWNRDYSAAAKGFSLTLEETFDLSASTGAWHALWLGRTLELMGDEDSANEMYARAHAAQRNIPAFLSAGDAQRQNLPLQIIEVMRQLKVNADGKIDLPRNMQTYLAGLHGKGTTNQTEESLRILGQYLGLHSSRPDKEFDTGPDVLWHSPGQPALCIEVKTNKDKTTTYQKKELGQLSDHVQWVKDNIDTEKIIPLFVGPISKADQKANPPKDFRVISLEQFHLLAELLMTALRDITNTALPLTLGTTIFENFQKRRLLWPECFDSMKSFILKEL
jgi:tetratricopeptide (TPR) repeat protein